MSTGKSRILIVDDESIMLNALADTLKSEGYEIFTAGNGSTALKLLSDADFDLLITDLRMSGLSGLDLLQKARELHPSLIVIVMTAYGTVEAAVSAMKQGAFDFIEKPFSYDKIRFSIQRALNTTTLIRENTELKRELKKESSGRKMLGNSPRMRRIYDLIDRVAEINVTVLITGESGTGKEVVADVIHAQSPRAKFPLIKVNCAALPETLLESELFGHLRGSFTGAISNKKGRFELADGGTLFLDEIGDISPKIQIKLLRVMQDKVIEPVGSEESIQTDVRLIAATNKNLEDEIKKGNFREDLFYRLNVLNISLPPLRERKEDIPLLVEHFLVKFSQELNKKVIRITPDALNILLEHNWPGNIRELENTIQRAIVLSNSDTINAADLLPQQLKIVEKTGDTLEDMEKRQISLILSRENWNISRASETLGIDRKTLYNKISKYGLKNGQSL
ncbi:MAG: sigma-54 dependent transcriptional regulator [Candidatus Wallbacteria bacterium]|nr:sigma-54 dependent transcriptional regulator [Candidatus Wallbacteria bacterium]